MNEQWRDYSKYTDEQLDNLLKGLAGQPDYAAVVFEYHRRQNARRDANNKSLHQATQRLARWAMIFAALSAGVGIVLGLIPRCSNQPPSNSTHSEPITAPSTTPLEQAEAEEPKQEPARTPEEQPRPEPIITPTPEETQEESPEEPVEEEPEESPTPSNLGEKIS